MDPPRLAMSRPMTGRSERQECRQQSLQSHSLHAPHQRDLRFIPAARYGPPTDHEGDKDQDRNVTDVPMLARERW